MLIAVLLPVRKIELLSFEGDKRKMRQHTLTEGSVVIGNKMLSLHM